jgi:hypothetical protein
VGKNTNKENPKMDWIDHISRTLTKYFLAVKYWLQGDSWKGAVEYAEALTQWTKITK